MMTLQIDALFVDKWSKVYDAHFSKGTTSDEDKAVRKWMSELSGPKYITKGYLTKLCLTKSARINNDLESNINQITRRRCLNPAPPSLLTLSTDPHGFFQVFSSGRVRHHNERVLLSEDVVFGRIVDPAVFRLDGKQQNLTMLLQSER